MEQKNSEKDRCASSLKRTKDEIIDLERFVNPSEKLGRRGRPW